MNMESDITWLTEAGLDIQSGISYTGRVDKYISAVQRFFKNYEKNRAKIEEYLASGDLENYRITVHALKSNSKMIGAVNLSESFETLEAAAESNDTGIIDELSPRVLNDYAALVEKLAPVNTIGDARAADEISAEVAKETAAKLLEALDDFDDDLAKKLANRLSGYPFRMTQAAKLREAVDFIEDFMYDEAADIIKEIAPEIDA